MTEKRPMPEMLQEDEIDLRELVNVIIKRKRMILVVFALSVCAAAGMVLLQPKLCEVSMLIEPPILEVADSGVILYSDSPENIMARIESEAFNQEVLKVLKLYPQVEKIGFKTFQPKGSKLIKVHILEPVEAGETGVSFLSQLFSELSKYYNKMLEPKKDSIDRQIASISNNTEIKMNTVTLLEKRLKLLEEREVVLADEIKAAQLNKGKFLATGEGLLDMASQENGVVASLYASVMQQSITYVNQLQNEMSDLRFQKENIKNERGNFQSEMNNIKLEVEKLNRSRTNIHDMGLIQEPYISQRFIKPDIKKRVIIAGVLGLMLGMFLAFVLEAWGNTGRFAADDKIRQKK